MPLLEIIGGGILLLLSIILILLVIMQESKQQNDGAITGASNDSYYSKNQTRTRDVILAKFTKYIAIIFFISIILVNGIKIFVK